MQLENSDTILQTSTINADGIFNGSGTRFIDVSFQIDLTADTITPVVAYETSQGGGFTTVTGSPIDISGTNLFDAINGSYTVGGQAERRRRRHVRHGREFWPNLQCNHGRHNNHRGG